MPAAQPAPSHDRIKARAHEIWLSEGRPEGRELAHWQQAEAEIMGTGKPAAKPRAPARATKSRAKAAAE